MADYAPACQKPSNTGLVDIKVAVPSAINSPLLSLGHATDMVNVSDRSFMHDVHGDRNGGPQGPPIEVQYLGHIVVVSFALSSYTQATVDLLRQRAVNTTLGTVDQAEVGDFLLETKSIRLLLHTEDPLKTRNFWCALVRDPIDVGLGTKFSEKRFQFTCYRPPCGHFRADILEDKNSDVPSS